MRNRPKPPLRYFGSKFRLAPWIVRHLPDHDLYLEPFGGAASVLLAKPQSRVEIYNDLDGEVVNFFRVLRDRPEELQRAVDLTPFSRQEFDLAHEPADDPLEAARRYAVLSWQGFGGAVRGARSGWRTPTKTVDTNSGGCSVAATTWSRLDLMEAARRLRSVSLECRPAGELLHRYDLPGAVYYLDPPYVLSTRRRPERAYRHEMTDAEHRELLGNVLGLEHAAVAISGYESEIYSEMLGGWEFKVVEATRAREVLWLNQRAVERLHPTLPFQS